MKIVWEGVQVLFERVEPPKALANLTHFFPWKEVESAKTTTKPITPWVVTKENSHYTWLLICTKAKSIMGLFVDRFVDWLTTSDRPLSIVNDPGFQGRPTFLDRDSRCLRSSDSRIHCRITCEEATPARWQEELGRLAANSTHRTRADVLIAREPIGRRQ